MCIRDRYNGIEIQAHRPAHRVQKERKAQGQKPLGFGRALYSFRRLPCDSLYRYYRCWAVCLGQHGADVHHPRNYRDFFVLPFPVRFFAARGQGLQVTLL